MAIRDKIKAKFSKNKSSGSTSSSSKEPIPGHYTGRTDIEYYKPHEIPKSKYRGRVDKAHQETLDAFSFEDAFQMLRRPSALSGTFSPGGTKAFSRRTSYASNAGAQTPARSRRSSLSSDANNSFSVPSSESASTYMRGTPAALTPANPTLDENAEDDTDVTNTGLSKLDTVKDVQPQSNIPVVRLDREATRPEKDPDMSSSNTHIEHSRSSGEMPFSPEELTQAMSRATITPPTTIRKTSMAVVAAA